MSKLSARIWPYAIGSSIVLVFGFCVATVIITSNAGIQESNNYMSDYHSVDAAANDLIENKIAFDKKYTIEYINSTLKKENSLVKFKVIDKESHAVENAKIKIKLFRPETVDFDQTLENPSFSNGVYTFNNAKFSKAGVWNIMTKVSVADTSRFYNVKVDTRNKNSYEY